MFVGHGVMFINDRRPRATADGRLQTEADLSVVPTTIQRGASIGSGAVVLCGVTIAAGAMIGAGAARRRKRGYEPVMMGMGVIGYGYWGPNLVRNFAEQRDAQVRALCDLCAAPSRTLSGAAIPA